MLRKFRVSNFKCFEKDFELDLTDTRGYEFNTECIDKNTDTIRASIIYGHNGSGKSNLALAMFDLIEHLTDINKSPLLYNNYLCAYSNDECASFYFEFLINAKIVTYEYKKLDYETLLYERLVIDNQEVVILDRTDNNTVATINLIGAETLNNNITNKQLSVVKYIKNNSVLTDDDINITFIQFMDFVKSMLFFRSLDNRMYLGLREYSNETLLDTLIKKDKIVDFENFLNETGITCKIKVIDNNIGNKILAFDFNGKLVSFEDAASTGTISLMLFYCWYLTVLDNEVSFLFIDEFDAFYHTKLSKLIVKKLKNSKIQFILTSHNVAIMTNDLLRPDCYFSMNKDKIVSFSNLTDKELRQAHNLEKMYKGKMFDVE